MPSAQCSANGTATGADCSIPATLERAVSHGVASTCHLPAAYGTPTETE